MAPDTLSLRYFLVLAAELNFTRAAERIGIAQPALSTRIRRLESDLGTPLLLRTTRTVELTEAGAALAESATTALAALDRAWEQARRIGVGDAGPLRIGYSLSAGSDTAPTLVDALLHRLPGLEITAAPMPTPEISDAVAAGQIDVGITRGEQPGRGVRRFPLRRERIGVRLSVNHPLAGRDEIEIADVAAYPVQLHIRDANPTLHDQYTGMFRDAPQPPRFVTPTLSFDNSQRVLRTSTTVAPSGEAALDTLPPGLAWKPLRGAPKLTVCLVLPRELAPLHRRVRAMAKDLAGELHWLV